MSVKLLRIFSIVMLVTLLAACAPAAVVTPQVIENTVVVKETVVAKETVVSKETVVAKETVVVVAPTAVPVEAKSDVQELRVIEMADWNSAFRMSCCKT